MCRKQGCWPLGDAPNILRQQEYERVSTREDDLHPSNPWLSRIRRRGVEEQRVWCSTVRRTVLKSTRYFTVLGNVSTQQPSVNYYVVLLYHRTVLYVVQYIRMSILLFQARLTLLGFSNFHCGDGLGPSAVVRCTTPYLQADRHFEAGNSAPSAHVKNGLA